MKELERDSFSVACSCCGRSDEQGDLRARLDPELALFVDARVLHVAERLSRNGRRRFFSMPYADQAGFVLFLVAKGVLS